MDAVNITRPTTDRDEDADHLPSRLPAATSNEVVVNCASESQKKTLERLSNCSQKANRSAPANGSVAIIGMGCHLPGSVRSPSEMWEFLKLGQSGHCSVPKDRFNADGFYHTKSGIPGTVNSKEGFFIDQDLRLFDNSFFGLNNLETLYMDPQQRKLLEVVFQCIEDAGIRKEDLNGANVGCYVANFTYDYQVMQLRDPERLHRYSAAGLSTAILANRISYIFNLKGPSIVLDSACSSSLYAVHSACQALNAGDCDAAIVAGANLILSPELHTGVAKAGMLSRDSISHTFDESADGYGRAEGVAALYLKRVADAVQDDDSIRSVIRGSAVNSNGRTTGITLPSISGQESVIRKAYANAGLNPEHVSYVEAHGTGTQAGDPIEAEAISKVFGKRQNRILIGSVKPNFGHGEGVSGITSIIKATLILEHCQIPASIGIDKVNPKIKTNEWNLEIVRAFRSLPHDGSPIIGVNSFGFGGANGHLVLESAKSYQNETASTSRLVQLDGDIILPFSANSPSALKQRASEIDPSFLSPFCLPNLLHHLTHRRSLLPTRGYVKISPSQFGLAIDTSQIKYNEKLQQTPSPKIAFVFSGQGSQWPGMGAQLIQHHPLYRKVIRSLDAALRLLDDSPSWTIEGILSSGATLVHQASISQPLITATQIALVDVLRSWGVEASAAVGHSSGEIAAAYSAGYLTATEAVYIAYYRGMFVSRLYKKGAMAAIGLSREMAERLIDNNGFDGHLSIAAINSPRSVTISGDVDAIDSLSLVSESQSLFYRKLQTGNVAYHSEHMDPIKTPYTKKLAEFLRASSISPGHKSKFWLVSTVTGELATRDQMREPEYWGQNLRCPVEFAAATTKMFCSCHYTTIEIGPHPVLKTPLKQINSHLDTTPTEKFQLGTLSRQRSDIDSLYQLAGDLFVRGYVVDFEAVNFPENLILDTRFRPLHDLPAYPWQYQAPAMSESRLSYEFRSRRFARHDLLGSRVVGGDGIVATWRNIINLSQLPWLNDHKVGSEVLFPAAGYLSLAIEAKKQLQHIENIQFQDVSVSRALFIADSDENVELFTTLKPLETNNTELSADWHHFQVSSYINSHATIHSSGLIRGTKASLLPLHKLETSNASIQQESIQNWYDRLLSKGFAYGPALQAINSISRVQTGNSSLMVANARWIRKEDTDLQQQSEYHIHPICLDLMLQTGIISSAYVFAGGLRRVIPRFIQNIHISSACSIYLSNTCEIRAHSEQMGPNVVQMNSQLTEDSGEVLAQLIGTRTVPFPVTLIEDHPESKDPLLRIVWKPDISKITIQDTKELTRYVTGSAAHLPQGISCPINQGIAAMLDLVAHQDPTKRILVLGDDSIETTKGFLSHLRINTSMERSQCYVQAKLDGAGVLEFHFIASSRLRGEKRSFEQIFEAQQFDLVILLHTASGINLSAVHTTQLRKLLSDEALILACEEHAGISLELREGGTTSTIATLANDMFSGVSLKRANMLIREHDMLKVTSVVIITRTVNEELPPQLLFHLLDADIGDVKVVALSDLSEDDISGEAFVISLLEVYTPLLADINQSDLQQLQFCISQSSTIIWLVSRGSFDAQMPESGLAIGLARSISLEMPALNFITLNLDASDVQDGSFSRHVTTIVNAARRDQVADKEYFVRNGLLNISRFVPEEKMNRHFRERQNIHDSTTQSGDAGRFRLSMRVPNQLDSINFIQDDEAVPDLSKNHVEIKVEFIGLNAKDVHVLTAKVDTLNATCSLEFTGTIHAVGSSVSSFKRGDRVVAMAPNHFSNYVQVPDWSCAKLECNEDLSTASTIPIVYSTVVYALEKRANIQPGESVLIHSGASAVGMAAIQFAVHKGAIVYTTVSSQEKREFVINVLQLPKARVLLLDHFSFEIMELTENKGVDVILNSRVGEFFRASWQVCAEFGRFVDIAKAHFMDGTKLEMNMFKRDVTFTAFDITNQYNSSEKKQQASWKSLLERSLELWRNGTIKVLKPVEVFSISDVAAAFKTQARRKHIGKIAVSFQDPKSLIRLVPSPYRAIFDPSKVYLMVGCLGGLGRCLTRWMFKRGARKFVHLSRSGARTEASIDLVSQLEKEGAKMDIFCGSVANKDDVNAMISKIADPIGGVFFSAMVIEAKIFSTMSVESWHNSLDPKVKGVWNIHNALRIANCPLDHFVLLSSVSGSVGAPAEGNYCAANSFQDTFAKYRRSLGLPGISIGLGMISEAGYLHEKIDVQAKLYRRGIQPLSLDEFLQVVDLALTDESSSEAALGNDYNAEAHLLTGLELSALRRDIGSDSYGSESYLLRDPRMALLLQPLAQDSNTEVKDVTGGRSGLPKTVAFALAACGSLSIKENQADPENGRKKLLEAVLEELIHQMAHLLMIQPETLNRHTNLVEFGMDSMLSAEFRTYIYNAFGVDLAFASLADTSATVASIAAITTDLLTVKVGV